MKIKKTLVGKLVRFNDFGIGVVDVAEEPQYVYFKPAQIRGYRGETVRELTSRRKDRWSTGAVVRIEADKDAVGNVRVHSVALG